jgi:hypothetical protein
MPEAKSFCRSVRAIPIRTTNLSLLHSTHSQDITETKRYVHFSNGIPQPYSSEFTTLENYRAGNPNPPIVSAEADSASWCNLAR